MHRFLSPLLIACLLLVGASPSLGMIPRFEHLTTDDGLPENSVRSILQDRLGFLWFGTHAGLVRYDGYDMQVFVPHPDDPYSIFPRFIVALAEDDTGMIWVGSHDNGLAQYNPGTEHFTNYRPDPTDPNSLPGSRVEDIFPADDGLWCALGDGGLVRFDGEIFHRVPIRLPDGPADLDPYPALTSLLITEDRIWVGTESSGLAVRDRRGGPWLLLREDPWDSRSLPSDAITDIFLDRSGRTWIATRAGLALYRGDDGFETYIPDLGNTTQPETNYLVKIDADEHGDLWIGSAVGLYHFDPRQGNFTLYAHDPDLPSSPVRGPALSVLVDRSGIIWAGSWHTGLNKFDPWSRKFSVLRHDAMNPGSLDDDAVMALFEDRAGVLWVGTGSLSSGGTSGGLNRMKPGSDVFDHLPTPAEPDFHIHRFNAITEDRQGRLWLGSNKGMWRLNEDRTQIIRPPELDPDIDQLINGSVTSLLLDKDDRLWVTTWNGGLNRFDPATNLWVSYWHDPRDNTSLSSNELTSLCLDDQGRVWVGTDGSGTQLYRPQTDDFLHIPTPVAGAGTATSLFPATDGKVWVGTSAGLLLASDKPEIEWSFTTHDGLPSDFLGSIEKAPDGQLWVSTAKGLVRLNTQTLDHAIFDRRDGLPRNELHFASLLHSDGRLMFGGHHGMISFDPRDVKNNPFTAPVVLTDLKVDDESLPVLEDSPLESGLAETHQVIFDHDQNNLSITFSSLHFAHPERNQYRYRLDPYDDDWRTADQSRTAKYTNLDPGQYQFEVMGSNSDGDWNPDPAVLAIIINPPWWQSHPAWALYALLAALATWSIYRQIVARERIRNKLEIKRLEARQLQELDVLKSRFFANISHEFRTPLTLLKAGTQRLWDDASDPDDELYTIMTRNANRLGQLIEQLLDLSRLESGHLPVRWQHGNWRAYLQDLVSSHEALAQSGEIDFKTQWPNTAPNAWFDADILDKVVGNLLTNALKFTPPGGTIEVLAVDKGSIDPLGLPGSDKLLDDKLRLIPARLVSVKVRNTGSIIPTDQLERIFDRFHQIAGPDGGDGRGTGIGLSLVKELVEWFGGTISVESNAQSGTTFEVGIPVFLESPLQPEDALVESMPLVADISGTEDETLEEEEEAPSRRLTILVVEDHPDLRALMRRELAEDYDLLEAPDGMVGLDLARQEIPDLVLTDIMMPLLDGYELCRRLKTDERTNHIPVVMLTAKTDSESRMAGLKIGADDYLTKPFDIAELKQRIANLLEQRRLLTERLSRWAIDPKRQPQPVESADEVFLERAKEVIAVNIEDSEFRVDSMCSAMAMSRTQLHRKLKAVTGQSTGEFMRTQRLLRAAELLSGGGGNVTDVAYSVGFKSLSHFAKAFREQFGVSPSDYG